MARRSSLRGILLGGALLLAAMAAVSLGGVLATAVAMQREVVGRTMLLVEDQRTAQQIVIAMQAQLLTAKRYLVSPRPELAGEFQRRGTGAYQGIRYYLFRDLQPDERLLVERIKEQHAVIEVLALDLFALADQGRTADAEVQADALLTYADSLESSIERLQETRLAESQRLVARHAVLTGRMYSVGGGVALLFLASVALLAGVLRRRLLEPLQALSEAAHRLGRGELATRVEVRTLDELGEVGTSFNAMASELEGAYARAMTAEQRFHGLVQGVDAIVWEQDGAGGAFTFVSSQLHPVLGYTPKQWLDDPAFRASIIHPDDLPLVQAAMADAVATGRDYAVEYRARAADGRELWFRDQVRVVGGSEESGPLLRAVMLDTTERIRAQQELERAKEAAEDANRAKSGFLSSMSHELRTPLNSVIGFAGVLLKNRSGTLAEQDLKYLDRIHANGRHLLGLINDVLDLSKIEAGKMEVERRPLSVGELVSGTLEELAGAVRGSSVALRAVVPEGVEPLETDPGKLKQVLINLVGNAVKFTEKGSVTVSLAADPRTGRPLRLEVADTGVGIPPERLAAIFGAFEQAESGIARRYGGTGLGLTISRSLCELMGHRLEVASEPGAGSTFTVVFGGAGGEACAPERPRAAARRPAPGTVPE